MSELSDVDDVAHARSPHLALEHPALEHVDIVLLDAALPGTLRLRERLAATSKARVILCAPNGDRSWFAGEPRAAGVLLRDALTPESVLAALRAATLGVSVFDERIVHAATTNGTGSGETGRPAGNRAPRPSRFGLSEREHDVLTLVADGLITREIAVRLSYSERTIKTVLHDIAVKFGVRTRSEAVAFAVREHII